MKPQGKYELDVNTMTRPEETNELSDDVLEAATGGAALHDNFRGSGPALILSGDEYDVLCYRHGLEDYECSTVVIDGRCYWRIQASDTSRLTGLKNICDEYRKRRFKR